VAKKYGATIDPVRRYLDAQQELDSQRETLVEWYRAASEAQRVLFEAVNATASGAASDYERRIERLPWPNFKQLLAAIKRWRKAFAAAARQRRAWWAVIVAFAAGLTLGAWLC
jgi:hypothetical protein